MSTAGTGTISALRPTFILWRHVIRELLPPTALGFLLFTFLMLMRFLLHISRLWIQYGTELSTVLWAIAYSLPHIVVLTLPMGVLVGGLLAFGRMSSDFEIVALRALGFSMLRLVPPVLLFATAMWAVTSYLFLVMMPWGNSNLREMQWEIITQRAFSQEFEPRVFNEEFPGLVLYIEDVVDHGSEWRGVFAAQTASDPPTIIRAERAIPIIDEVERRTYLELVNGTVIASASNPRDVTVTRFERQRMLVWSEDEHSVLGDPGKDGRSMTLVELREAIALRQENGDPAYDFQVEVHKKFALPFACVVMGLISLALGASTQRQTTAAGFAIGTGVILVYYFFAQNGEQKGDVGEIAPWLGIWAANIILGIATIVLLLARARERDLGIIRRLLPLWERLEDLASAASSGRLLATASASRSMSRGSFPRILDRYVIWSYTSIYALSFSALVVVWVVIDWLEKASYVAVPALIPRYMSYQIFGICSDVIPVAAVITVLATFSLMTKRNEVTAALAGGVSLYRLILPVLIPAITLTGARFVLQDYVLPTTTRLAEEIAEEMHPTGGARALQQEQTWVFSEGQRVFHFADYAEGSNEFRGLRIYYLAGATGGLARMEYADRAVWNPAELRWEGYAGWRRHFVDAGGTGDILPNPLEEFRYSILPFVEPPAYFQQTPLQPEEMTLLDLRRHVELLRERGYATERSLVDYNLKVASPFVVLVMSLVGIPFAFRSGRHGALTGVAVAVALVIVYFICFAVFRALGYAGELPPMLAAWAPHLLFLALAAHQALGLRT